MNLCDRNEIQELLRRHGFRFQIHGAELPH